MKTFLKHLEALAASECPLNGRQFQREVFHALEEIMKAMDKLNASIAALTTAINAFIASQAGSVPQAQVDAAAATLDTLTASVVAATPKA